MNFTSSNIGERPRVRIIFLILIILLITFFILDLFLGSVSIRVPEVLNALFGRAQSNSEIIVRQFRIPKAITAILAGVALSLSGLQMQTVFRNPMAGPYVLGISSGASLGVALVILGLPGSIMPGTLSFSSNWIMAIASWLGAGIVMLIIMIISSRMKDIMTVLILGIMLSGGISAVVTILQYFSNETMLKAYVIWTMGSLGNLTSNQISVLAFCVIGGVLISIFSSKMLNALLLGENYAESIGLNVKTARTIIFIGTSILAGSVTAFCGPIGFIGIAVPHMARMMFRTSDHLILVPSVILIGGIVMLCSDILSQIPGSDIVLPLNSITSLIGIPVVIWVIFHNKRFSG